MVEVTAMKTQNFGLHLKNPSTGCRGVVMEERKWMEWRKWS